MLAVFDYKKRHKLKREKKELIESEEEFFKRIKVYEASGFKQVAYDKNNKYVFIYRRFFSIRYLYKRSKDQQFYVDYMIIDSNKLNKKRESKTAIGKTFYK